MYLLQRPILETEEYNMKKLAKQLTAIFTAAIMTVLSAAVTVSAADTAGTGSEKSAKYTGWVNDENGWQYLTEGIPYKSEYYKDSLKIDGVHYRFFSNGYCWGKYTNWSESGKRYYQDGVLYTGWLNKADGTKQYYCLDGYPVTGDFQIGDTVYSFDKNGIYKGKSAPAVLTASCAEKVSADSEKILTTVKHSGGDNKEYIVCNPEKMERWENGKWQKCGKPFRYAVDDIGMVIDGTDDCSPNYATAAFYPNRYMGGDMPTGYYRIAVPCGESENYSKTKKDVYAVFEAVPAVEVKMSEDIYVSDGSPDIDFQAYVKINSEKLKVKDISVKIEEKTVSGWETAVEEFKYGQNASCDSVSADGTISVNGSMPAKTGYYRAVLNINGKNYSAPFRIDKIWAKPWLDGYSLKSDDITVSFTVCNRCEKPVKISTNPHSLFKMENYEWTDMSEKAGRNDCVETAPSYTVLEKGRITLNFDLSKYYDTSKLTAGDYVVWIDGAGYAEFRLTDKEPKPEKFPFANLKSDDIKEIQLKSSNASMGVTTVIRGGNGKITNTIGEEDQYGIPKATAVVKNDEQLERVIDYLRQFELGEAYTEKNTYAGGTTSVIVRYKNNTKKTLDFIHSDIVTYNGKRNYYCGEQLWAVADDLIKEINKDYYASFGYA